MDKGLKQVCVAFLAIFWVGTLLDFFMSARVSRVETQWSQGCPNKDQYTADLKFSGMVLDHTTKSIAGQVEIWAEAPDPESTIDELHFSWVPAVDGSRDWTDFPTLTSHEVVDGPAGESREAVKALAPLQFNLLRTRSARLYPFDAYWVKVDPVGCVGSVVPNCFKFGNIAIRRLTAELAEGQFFEINQEDDSGTVLRIARPFFVRWVSFWFAVVSIAFLVYLLFFVNKTEELLPKALGYFAALWGLRELMAPDSVKVFPTAIDHFILTVFVTLFIVVASKSFRGETI